MTGLVKIPGGILKEIATGSERIPTMYYNEHAALRWFFWLRLSFLHDMIAAHAPRRGSCLDFGGGGGVFLPTLSRMFDKVYSIDLETTEAAEILSRYGLENVRLVRGDILDTHLPEAPFDVIVAADVLEHFRELDGPVAALRDWLHPEGRLFTSLPTENMVYVLLRKLFNVTKPEDHYHTAREVERYLSENGFTRTVRRFMPLVVGVAPLFLISAWRADGRGGNGG